MITRGWMYGRYGPGGWLADLPALTTPRFQHACSSYTLDTGDTVGARAVNDISRKFRFQGPPIIVESAITLEYLGGLLVFSEYCEHFAKFR